MANNEFHKFFRWNKLP